MRTETSKCPSVRVKSISQGELQHYGSSTATTYLANKESKAEYCYLLSSSMTELRKSCKQGQMREEKTEESSDGAHAK